MNRLPACPGCGRAEDRHPEIVLREDGIDLVRCAALGCRLVYSNPAPTDGELADHYDEAYDDNDVGSYESSRARAFGQYVALMERLLAPGARTLDVGACFGTFVGLARAAGFDTRGIDISAPAVATAQAAGLPVEHGNLDDLADSIEGGETAPFAAVHLWDFLEHMPRPLPTLRSARRVLAEDGLLLCAVPDFRFQRVKVAAGRAWERASGRTTGLTTVIPRVHLIHYTPASLRATMRRAGLEPVLIRPGTQNLPKRKERHRLLKTVAKAAVRRAAELVFHATGEVVGQEIVCVARPIASSPIVEGA